ncbi:MAG: tlde1 domain-containing protein [Candidatus Omnitrophota bacterium]
MIMTGRGIIRGLRFGLVLWGLTFPIWGIGDGSEGNDADGPYWLYFNGSKIDWYRGEIGDKSVLMHTYPGLSGKPNKQGSKYTGIRRKGPIPEGTYFINNQNTGKAKRASKRRLAPGDGIQEVTGKFFIALWGKYRARLWPDKGTDTKGRSNFYLHTSKKGHTSGCIETRGDESVFQDLKDSNVKQIKMVVKYD